ncbi:MAG: serine/threonine protein kinase [Deltaproteobacteria bacterium]|nr:serine/threonine protein kinase [Deltaproteobacteria bacterium]
MDLSGWLGTKTAVILYLGKNVLSAPALQSIPGEERQFGRYRLLYRIASGGMANLYLARLASGERFEKLVAIKRIHHHLAQQEEFIHMLIDEARVAAQVTHPNVAQVTDFGDTPAYFIAMEYVDGESLVSVMRHAQLSLPICAKLIADAAGGLHVAHDLVDRDGTPLQVVHRDISPQNLLVSYDGAMKVIDFGVARARGNLQQTASGTIKGKLSYMSPEQISLKPVDRRSDIFSLGIVLYEITTRYRLFKAPNEAATIAKILDGQIAPPTRFIAGYPPDLERIVMRALAHESTARYATAAEMQRDLEAFIFGTGTPVVSGTIAEMMRSSFCDRIEEKRRLLRECEMAPVLSPAPQMEPSSHSLTMGGATVSAATFRRRQSRKAMLFVVAMLVLIMAAASGAFLFEWLSGDGGQEKAKPVAGSTLRQGQSVSFEVRADPEWAAIRVDGKAVSNPYRTSLAKAHQEMLVEVSAKGYRPHSFKVPAKEGGTFVITLDQDVDAGVKAEEGSADAGQERVSPDMKVKRSPKLPIVRKKRPRKARSKVKRKVRRTKPKKRRGSGVLFKNPYN